MALFPNSLIPVKEITVFSFSSVGLGFKNMLNYCIEERPAMKRVV